MQPIGLPVSSHAAPDGDGEARGRTTAAVATATTCRSPRGRRLGWAVLCLGSRSGSLGAVLRGGRTEHVDELAQLLLWCLRPRRDDYPGQVAWRLLGAGTRRAGVWC